jgi:hypothetical protein
MAQQWYDTIQGAVGQALRGDAAAQQTVSAELEAHPVLGPFAVQEVRALLSPGHGAGAGDSQQAWNSGHVASVLEIICMVAFKSRKTLQALANSLCDGKQERGASQDALWDAMSQVDWKIKLVLAAMLVPRLQWDANRTESAPASWTTAGGTTTARGGGAGVPYLVAEMVEAAVSVAQQTALLQQAADTRRRGRSQVQDHHVSSAAKELNTSSELLQLSVTTRTVLQALSVPGEDEASQIEGARHSSRHALGLLSPHRSSTLAPSAWDLRGTLSMPAGLCEEQEVVVLPEDFFLLQHARAAACRSVHMHERAHVEEHARTRSGTQSPRKGAYVLNQSSANPRELTATPPSSHLSSPYLRCA